VYAAQGVMPGTSALAVPLTDAAGAVVGAISVATLSARLPRERVKTALVAMQSQVARLTLRLGQLERARAGR